MSQITTVSLILNGISGDKTTFNNSMTANLESQFTYDTITSIVTINIDEYEDLITNWGTLLAVISQYKPTNLAVSASLNSFGCKFNGSVDAEIANSVSILNRTVINASTYTILPMNIILAVTYTPTGAVNLTLPLANLVPSGKYYYIIDEGGNAETNNITITRSGSDTIVGSTSILINLNYMALGLYSNGSTAWFLH